MKWLADNRRVLYFTKNGSELVVLTPRCASAQSSKPACPGPNEIFAISPDNRTIYYGAGRAEADIRIMERK